jgi:hypothetical protein
LPKLELTAARIVKGFFSLIPFPLNLPHFRTTGCLINTQLFGLLKVFIFFVPNKSANQIAFKLPPNIVENRTSCHPHTLEFFLRAFYLTLFE